MNTHDERRNYFRILDQVGVKYSVLGESAEVPAETSGEIELSLGAMLGNIDQEFNRAVNILWSESPSAADAVGLLNRKLSLLAARFLEAGDYNGAGYEGTTASISGCGMAFHCEYPLAVETRLNVWVALKPSRIVVNFTASVVACERASDIPARNYLLRISIDENCHAAREQLVQHVVQRQSARLGIGRGASRGGNDRA